MADLIASNGKDRDRRLAEAAGWRVVLSEADVETSDAFEAWLATDPCNAEAWAEAQALWDHFGEHAASPEIIAARRDALERASRSQRRRLYAGRRWSAGLDRIAASIAAVAVLAALGGAGAWWVTKADIYRTGLGERRTVMLADGSRVSMDSDTVLKVRLLPDARKLDLIRGQAQFDVTHDVSRPFSVHARDQTVVATGTSFNVDLMGPSVFVTLIEGRVSVLQDRATPPLGHASQAPRLVLARLVSGEQLITADPGARGAVIPISAVQVEKVNVDKATAWESGQLIFEDEPLASVAQRISRYAPHPVIAEGAVGALRISGVFNAGDISTFIDTIQRAFPVQAQQNDDGAVVLRRRG
jgi:transmembrane sensor